jgi:hypothetical protein
MQKINNMKTLTLIIALLIAGCAASFAQCGKKVVLTTANTQHLDASGAVERTVDEKAIVEINKSDLAINVNDEHKMTGKIKSDTCNWKVPYKDGKSIIKAVLTDEQGTDRNVTITIEGKDGKVTLLLEMDGMPDDRIKVTVVKFEEVS